MENSDNSRSWPMWGHDRDGTIGHIYEERNLAMLCGFEDTLVEVLVTEAEEGSNYRGWITRGSDYPALVREGMTFELCFTYGYEHEEARGNGKVVWLSVEKL